MTVYIYTQELHQKIERILADASWHIPEGSPLDRDAEAALAMLKAMQPVEPAFYMSKHQIKPRFYREGETLPTNVVELYTPTKD